MSAALIELPPVQTKLGKTIVELIKDDLTALPVDAFVFYAREDLALGSGYGNAIQQRGGAAVKKELDAIGSVGMGEAVITSAGAMKARYIIHACGPKFHEPDLEAKLRRTMRSALELADRHALKTVAFPPMGYGFYGVPLELCATVMLEEIAAFVKDRDTSLEKIIICVTDKREYDAWKDHVAQFSG